VSAFYEIYGTIRVRKCPKAIAIIARLEDFPQYGIELDINKCEPGILAVSLEGGSSFAAGEVLDFDKLLQSLGPYVVEPAILITDYEGDEGELIVARSDVESTEMLSRHRVDQIEVLLRDVTPEDRAKLADKLEASQIQ
jgi:hypothetical protein